MAIGSKGQAQINRKKKLSELGISENINPAEQNLQMKIRTATNALAADPLKSSIPKPAETTTDKTSQPKTETGQVFRNETGRPSGITLPDGRTFLGLSPDDVETIAAAEQAKKGGPATQAFEKEAQAAQQQQLIQQNQALTGQVGQTQVLPEQQVGEFSGINPAQAIGAGITQAATGAAAGALISGGTLAPAGAIGGFLNGVRTSISQQLGDSISVSTTNLVEREANLRNLIRAANVDPNNADQYLTAFNYQLSLVNQDYSKLKRETDRNLNKFLGKDGTPQLAKYETFMQAGGSKDYLINKMQMAILAPNPNEALTDVYATQ